MKGSVCFGREGGTVGAIEVAERKGVLGIPSVILSGPP